MRDIARCVQTLSNKLARLTRPYTGISTAKDVDHVTETMAGVNEIRIQ